MTFTLTPKEIFAAKIGLHPDELINFRQTEDGGAVAVIPTGQKIACTAQEMHDFAQVLAARMETNARILESKPVTKGKGGSATHPVETRTPPAIDESVTKPVETKAAPHVQKPVTKGRGGPSARPSKK